MAHTRTHPATLAPEALGPVTPEEAGLLKKLALGAIAEAYRGDHGWQRALGAEASCWPKVPT